MRVVVVGAGHNGLVCACYLARAGKRVLVLEQAQAPGGGSRTEETISGHRFDTHSAAHNIINMTSIPRELELAGAGLRYLEMDPFAVAVMADGRRVRFCRSIERTVASIAELDRREAAAYREFMADAVPLVRLVTAGLAASGLRLAGRLAFRVPEAVGLARRCGGRIVAEVAGSYGRLLEARLGSDLTRAPVSAFAAHAGAGPDQPGGALFGFWQAAYHLYGQWHADGGAGALTRALVRRLESLGGELRCNAPVTRIDAAGGRVRAVETEAGERIGADAAVTAIDPRTAALELLDPPLGGPQGAALAATRSSNAVQAVVHVATDRLPAYEGAREGDWNGLQSFVDGLDELRAAFHAAEDRRLAAPAPSYAFTPSALDASLAPGGGHTVYLASPAAPYSIEGGWKAAERTLADDLVGQVERRAPGFGETVRDVHVRSPETMAAELRSRGAHPMYLDVTLDQLGPLRPTPALARHRTPVAGLYLSGAGTAPVGGVAGAPGRSAARALLRDTAMRSGPLGSRFG